MGTPALPLFCVHQLQLSLTLQLGPPAGCQTELPVTSPKNVSPTSDLQQLLQGSILMDTFDYALSDSWQPERVKPDKRLRVRGAMPYAQILIPVRLHCSVSAGVFQG